MTISTYAELKTAIANWFMDRTDIGTTYGDEIIALAEAYFNQNLRVREMETVEDLTPDVDGVCTLPAEYIEAQRVVELASIRRPLEFITPEMADVWYADRAGGLASCYTIVGTTLTALPTSTNDIELTYWAVIPPLSGSQTTNWLLTKSPNLYLHTCLMYAAEFAKVQDQFVQEAALVARFVELLHGANERGKFGNAAVMQRGPTP
jgi:hypothetical protein